MSWKFIIDDLPSFHTTKQWTHEVWIVKPIMQLVINRTWLKHHQVTTWSSSTHGSKNSRSPSLNYSSHNLVHTCLIPMGKWAKITFCPILLLSEDIGGFWDPFALKLIDQTHILLKISAFKDQFNVPWSEWNPKRPLITT